MLSKSRSPYLAIVLTLLALVALPAAAIPIPAPPAVSGTGHILVDFGSGAVLAESNADTHLEPASLTKIMSAYVIFRELKAKKIHLDDMVPISEKAWRTGGSRMFVQVGTKVKLEDLIKGMVIQSGNDATVALAEYVAGTEGTFAEMMNSYAKRLGMTNSHFVDASGLPNPDHYTTPRDLAKVTAATIREFPQWYAWYSTKEFTYNNITQHNRNKLLWRDDAVDGVKTGHTEAAGYCLVASAKHQDMRLIAVVMGTNSENVRAKDAQALLTYGFRFYESRRLYRGGTALKPLRVWKGDKETVLAGLKDDLYVTVPRGSYDKVSTQVELNPRVVAPVKAGQQLGSVRIALDGKVLSETPLVALGNVAEGGIWDNVRDTVLLWLE